MRSFLLIAFSGLTLSACIPDIYLIDRQTVLEIEASGQWPELDKKYKDMALRSGPTALESTRDTVENRQIFSMTHDDKVKK
ncbi:MAG: hypothetical protein V4655_11895 [Bdellovibrionota bacterium]|nr:MAG: hypothetical protein EOP10_12560 [Pseudomonadota bacterium]RZA24092.1 MAG: hypothetical protein EOP10_10925 [Pseudomonadota bacterium]